MPLDDFKDVLERFDSLISQLQVTFSTSAKDINIISPRSVEFVNDVVAGLQKATVEQQKQADILGSNALTLKTIQNIRSVTRLESALDLSLTEEASREIQSKLDVVTRIADLGASTLRSITEQVTAETDLHTLAGLSEQLGEEILANERELADLITLQTKVLGPKLTEQLKTSLELRRKTLKSQKEMVEAQESQINLADKTQSIFGAMTKSIKTGINDFGSALNSTAGRLGIIGEIIRRLASFLVSNLQELRAAGLSVNQTFAAMGQSLRLMVKDGFSFVRLFRSRDIFTATLALRENFADIRFQTDEIVDQSSKLVTFMSLSGDEAGRVTEILTRMAGLSAAAQQDFRISAQAFGDINKINPAFLMKQVADETRAFALFADRGAESFFRSAAAAARIGLSLADVDVLAESFLDIDTFFQNISKLRTLGINIADPFALAQVAQVGTQEEIIAELQRQLEGIGKEFTVEGLGGRVQVKALEQTFGLGIDSLTRALEGKAAGELEVVTSADKARVDENDALKASFTALTRFITATGFATIALGLLAATATFKLGGGLVRGLLASRAVASVGAKGMMGGVPQFFPGAASTAAKVGIGGRLAAGIGTLGTRAAAVGRSGLGMIGAMGTRAAAVGATSIGSAGIAAVAGTVAVGLAAGVGMGELINRLTGSRSIKDMLKTRTEIKEFERRGEAADKQAEILRARNAPIHEAMARGASQEEIDRIKEQIRTGKPGAEPIVARRDAQTIAMSKEKIEAEAKLKALASETHPETVKDPELLAAMETLINIFDDGFGVYIDGRSAGKLIRKSFHSAARTGQ